MSGQARSAGRIGEFRVKTRWIVAGLFALLLVYLIAGRVAAMIEGWPPTIHEAVAPTHCDQFITLAKEAYGDNWRVRLDPRDTTCDREVRAAWERAFLPRVTPAIEPQMAIAPVVAPPAAAAVEAPEPDTTCLNAISLARAKFGDEWKTKVDPDCAPDIGD